MAIPNVMLLTKAGDAGLLGSYGRSFIELGCHVDFWDFEAVRAREAKLGAAGRFFQNFVPVEPWLKRVNRELVIAVRDRRPDVVGVGCCTRVTAGALAQIRASSPSTRLVLFWPDPLQNLEGGTVQALPLYDVVATYAQSSVEPLVQLGARRVEWVPFGADTALFPTAAEPGAAKDDDEFVSDVGFIGNYRPERERTARALQKAGVQVHVWGHGWKERAEDKHALRGYWRGRGLAAGPEFSRATRSFKLALNVIDPTNYPGANMRFFETMACGGTLLTSACPEFSTAFPDGVAAIYFDSTEQLIDRVRGALPLAPLRRAIAAEGQSRVLASHTYGDRARQLLRLLELNGPKDG